MLSLFSKSKQITREAALFSKLLASYCVGLVLLMVVLVSQGDENLPGEAVLLGSWALYLAAWIMARKNYLLAAVTTYSLTLAIAAVLAFIIIGGPTVSAIVFPYLLMPILISSFLIDVRFVALQTAISGAAAFVLLQINPSGSDPLVIHQLVFTIVAGAVCIFGSHLNRQRQMELLQAQSSVLGSAKLIGIGELASKLAHEINSPLAMLSMASQQIRDGLSSESSETINFRIKRNSEIVQSATSRMANIVKVLSQASKDSSTDHLANLILRDEVESILAVAKSRLMDSRINYEIDVPSDISARFNAIAFTQILINLINNAVDAMLELPESERILRISADRSSDGVQIKVKDSGHGVPENLEKRIFQPFFTTKGARGTGVGLSVSRDLASRFGGDLALANSERGAEFVLRMSPAS